MVKTAVRFSMCGPKKNNVSKKLGRFKQVITGSLVVLLLCVTVPVLAYTIKWVYRLNGGTATVTDGVYTTSAQDTSGVYATNAGELTLINPSVATTGSSSSADDSSFYGLNAGILADASSAIVITGGTVTTTGMGANGVFATNKSRITASDLYIHCTGRLGHGVDATYEGVLELTNVTAITTNSNGSVIATDRGGGTITVNGGYYQAGGQDSAGIYSTGTVTVNDATVGATYGEAVVVEGGNKAYCNNSVLYGAKGARDRGVMIYNSQSGDAESGTGYLTMTGGSYTWPSSTGPAFFVTNEKGVITLNGTLVDSSAEKLVYAAASDWGSSGKNGGTVNFTANSVELTGDLVADSISAITCTLNTSSSLTGAATGVKMSIDSTSLWNIDGDSTLTSLTNSGTVSFETSDLALTDSGTFTQTSEGTLRVLLGSDTNYNQIAVSGSATIAGTLKVDLVDDYTPVVGQTFTILTRGSGSGAFTTQTTEDTGLTYTVTYNATSIVIEIVTLPGGDSGVSPAWLRVY